MDSTWLSSPCRRTTLIAAGSMLLGAAGTAVFLLRKKRNEETERVAVGGGGSSALDLSNVEQHGIRIFLIRHGESEANIDKTIFKTKPDHAMNLTPCGRAMGRGAGQQLRQFLRDQYGTPSKMKDGKDHHVRLWTSPFDRTRQTSQEVLEALNEDPNELWVDSVRENPVLVEQDFGVNEAGGSAKNSHSPPASPDATEEQKKKSKKSFDTLVKERNLIKEHYRGLFWEKPAGGESSFEVTQRLAPLVNEIISDCVFHDPKRARIKTVIIVSHGNTIRCFQNLWCRLAPEWFSQSPAPPNCSIQLIENREHVGYIFPGYKKKQQIAERENEEEISNSGLTIDPAVLELADLQGRDGPAGGGHDSDRARFWTAFLNPVSRRLAKQNAE